MFKKRKREEEVGEEVIPDGNIIPEEKVAEAEQEEQPEQEEQEKAPDPEDARKAGYEEGKAAGYEEGKAAGYEEGFKAGEIKGRNARIEELLSERNDSDGLPHPGGSGSATARRRPASIFDLARDAGGR